MKAKGARAGPGGVRSSTFAQELMMGAAADALPGGSETMPLVMMVAGAPNVGKSTIINAMRQQSAHRGRGHVPPTTRNMTPAKMGKAPGVTRSVHSFQARTGPLHAARAERAAVVHPVTHRGGPRPEFASGAACRVLADCRVLAA